MSFDTLREEVETRFQTLWGALTPVAYGDNADFSAVTDVSWVRITTVPISDFNAQLGDGMTRQSGAISVQIFTPKDTGEKEALGLAETVRTIFENQVFGGVHAYASSLFKIGPQKSLWYQVNVNTPYRFDEFS